MSTQRVLVLAFGNPGRRDDGLGPALAAELERLDLPGVTVQADYQLSVEDAAAVAEHDAVIFVDAACSGPEPFAYRRLTPQPGLGFSSHSVSPAGVLALAEELFQARPQGYLLAIRGYEFDEFGEGLSAAAQANLVAAVRFLQSILRKRTLSEGAGPAACVAGAAAPSSGDR